MCLELDIDISSENFHKIRGKNEQIDLPYSITVDLISFAILILHAKISSVQFTMVSMRSGKTIIINMLSSPSLRSFPNVAFSLLQNKSDCCSTHRIRPPPAPPPTPPPKAVIKEEWPGRHSNPSLWKWRSDARTHTPHPGLPTLSWLKPKDVWLHETDLKTKLGGGGPWTTSVWPRFMTSVGLQIWVLTTASRTWITWGGEGGGEHSKYQFCSFCCQVLVQLQEIEIAKWNFF